MFVCLDIETTGFDLEKDKIIEIAAVKFEPGKIYEQLETLINPEGAEVPAVVKMLTGISSLDLEKAPAFSEETDGLREFLNDLPIVGHNIAFDISFLEAEGLELKNQLLDTYELARVLFPNELSYALDILAKKMNFKNRPSHRAKEDILATIEFFELLLEKIKKNPPHVQLALNEIFKKSDWPLKTLFASCR